ncbi:hypothetical protein GCM10022224_013610 [Nonomuraea antimicrobica]|uniref:Phosphotransferase enzyme family protein n=1 Tax=Nonomuraea antimicrobica TaxID=561173 RepID=A0ABP7B7M7_9ACTN
MTSRHTDSGQRAFLWRILAEGARRLGASLTGDPVFGWHDRTIGSAALRQGGRFWLRATAEHHDWTGGETWTGNQDAADITGVPKPDLLGRVEWDEPPVAIYAELLTYVPEAPCSPTPELTVALALPDAWWTDLRSAVDTLATHPTHRGATNIVSLARRVEEFYEQPIDPPEAPVPLVEHTDLHWANLTQPRLWILDWEHWGVAPAGYGAAVLYAHSLLVPAVARRVHDTFADLLDTPTGRLAQLSAAAHILHRQAVGGDYQTLATPVRALADRLLSPTRGR